jgi:hypothetical protein
MNNTAITHVQTLPSNPFPGCRVAGVAITNGVSSYFKVCGEHLENIVSVNWYPARNGSVKFETRQFVLADCHIGTFMIKILDNYLDTCDRAGSLIFKLKDGTNIPYPVKTYGPVSFGPMWRNPQQGLITG